MNAQLAPRPTPTDALLDDARTELTTQLMALGDTLQRLDALTDTRQRGLGFLTFEAAQAQDRLIRIEREARAQARRDGQPEPSGDRPAPGNLTAIHHLSLIHAALHQHIRTTIRALTRTGINVTINPPADAPTIKLRDHLWTITDLVTDRAILEQIAADLAESITEAAKFIDGTDRALLEDPCPHCGHRTLVAYFDTGIIECGKDPRTGHRHPCVCPDQICDCKRDPHGHHHRWQRNNAPTFALSWNGLANRLSAMRPS